MKSLTRTKQSLALALLVSLAATSNNVIRLDLERTEISELGRRGSRILDGAVQVSPVANYLNAQYSTTVYVGSARQQMSLLVDTGSALTWL